MWTCPFVTNILCEAGRAGNKCWNRNVKEIFYISAGRNPSHVKFNSQQKGNIFSWLVWLLSDRATNFTLFNKKSLSNNLKVNVMTNFLWSEGIAKTLISFTLLVLICTLCWCGIFLRAFITILSILLTVHFFLFMSVFEDVMYTLLQRKNIMFSSTAESVVLTSV